MPVELGSFSLGFVAGGAVVGIINHFLAKSRDTESRTAKDFNEAADILAEALMRERTNPRPESTVDFFSFTRVLSKKELINFNKCIEDYQKAKKDAKINKFKDPLVLGRATYQDPTSIIEAIDKLMMFTKRK